MKAKNLALVFAFFGVIAGVGYWLYLYYTDPDNAPTVGDFYEILKSYFRKGTLAVSSIDVLKLDNANGDPDYITKALRIIAGFETFSPRVYPDAGNLAIGYGHDIIAGDGFDSKSTITESEAWDLLREDVTTRFAPVLSFVSVDISDNQKAALISFAYNVGVGAFKSSTMLKLINQGSFDQAANEFDRWTHSAGVVSGALLSRRAEEKSLFLS